MDRTAADRLVVSHVGSGERTEKSARRLMADLVLLPREYRGSATYPEDYLQRVSGCRLWTRLRCAYCNCHKADED